LGNQPPPARALEGRVSSLITINGLNVDPKSVRTSRLSANYHIVTARVYANANSSVDCRMARVTLQSFSAQSDADNTAAYVRGLADGGSYDSQLLRRLDAAKLFPPHLAGQKGAA